MNLLIRRYPNGWNCWVISNFYMFLFCLVDPPWVFGNFQWDMFFGANVKGVSFRGPVLPPKTMVWLVICRVRGQDVSVKILRWYNFQGTITDPTVQGSQPEHHRLKWVPAIGGNIYVIVHWRGPLGPSKRLFRRNRSPGISKIHRSGQIIATVSRPFQNVVEECAPNNALNSGLGIIVIRSDRWILPSLCFRNSFLKVSCRRNSRKSGSVEECSYHEIWRKVSLKVSLLNNWNLNYSHNLWKTRILQPNLFLLKVVYMASICVQRRIVTPNTLVLIRYGRLTFFLRVTRDLWGCCPFWWPATMRLS